ncbi:death-associated inhibitor of apoptosis 2-like [Actinia tenebrosa]|uniref:Death-associated inhibitor of apoptosis 2-like n=1 Tax=Actinia tenebrosa TaxID=6105 RepID=A0A6P8GZV1_ACTTE|nr:death-associated inhibitor of apoptosis 2-like [Actinia tenebrosa]
MERRYFINGFTSELRTNNQAPVAQKGEEVLDCSLRRKEDKISGSSYPASLSSSKDEHGSQYSSYNSLEQARINAYLDDVNRLRCNIEEVHPDVDDEMASEKKRLETFNQWPKESPVKPIDLVKAGFYYTGPEDRVSCFSCDLQLHGWVEGDNPFEEHKRLKPNCIFIFETERENYAVTCHGEPVSTEVISGNNPLRQLPTTRPYIEEQYKEQSFKTYNPSIVNSGYFEPRFQTPSTAPYYLSHVNPLLQPQQAALQERYLQQRQEPLNPYRDPRSLVSQELSSNRSEQFISATGNSLPFYDPRPTYQGYPPVNYPSSVSQNWYPPQTNPYLKTPDEFSMAAIRPSVPRLPHTRFSGIDYYRFPAVTQERLAPASGRVPASGHHPPPHYNKNSGIPVLHPMPSEEPRVRTEDALHITSPKDLQSEHHRMTTFVDWPEDCPVRPWELASAGFYYLGNQDNVKCYKCAIMLRNWEPHDTPWEEHKRWSPDCSLVIAHYKGKHAYRPVEDQEQVPTRIPSSTSQAKEQIYPKSAQPQISQFEQQGRNTHWRQKVGVASSAEIRQSTHPSYYSSHPQERTQDYPRTFYKEQENTSSSHHCIPHVPEQARRRHLEEEILSMNESRSPQFSAVSHEPVISTSSAQTTAQSSPRSSGQAVSNLSQIPSTEVSFCETNVESEDLSASDVSRAMEMGFTRDAIDEAIAIKTQRTGNGFTNLDDLMQTLLDNQSSTSSAQQTGGTCRPDPEPQVIDRNVENVDQREQAQLNLGLVHSISYHQDPANGSKQVLKRSNSAPPGSATKNGTLSTSTQEMERTQEERLICKICMDAEVGIVFLPCGHISCCPNCASGLDLCPMCRNPIVRMHRTFLS